MIKSVNYIVFNVILNVIQTKIKSSNKPYKIR